MANERILIVADSRMSASALAIKCRALGYQVAGICTNSEEAVIFAAREPSTAP